MRGYPVVLNVSGKHCVVIGGGRVAERKVDALLTANAHVQVVSPAVTDVLERRASHREIEMIRRRFHAEDVTGAVLVIAATNDPETNLQVHRSIGPHQWINMVDRPDLCTFSIPAVVERGDLQVAISTGGNYPGFAKKLKEQLKQVIGPEYADHVRFLGDMRAQILRWMPPSPSRQQLLMGLMDDSLLAMTRSGHRQQRDQTARQLIQSYRGSEQ